MTIKEKIENVGEKIGNILLPSDDDYNSNSTTLLSNGSLIGISIGMILSSLFGSNLFIGIIILIIGIISLKKNWYLMKN